MSTEAKFSILSSEVEFSSVSEFVDLVRMLRWFQQSKQAFTKQALVEEGSEH